MSPLLVVAALEAPVVGVDPAVPDVLHAVTMEGVVHAWPKADDADAVAAGACGVEGLKLLAWGEAVVPWPPRVASLPEGWSRCRDCHAATGRMRPRSGWRANA